jgi:hypothetical protein
MKHEEEKQQCVGSREEVGSAGSEARTAQIAAVGDRI